MGFGVSRISGQRLSIDQQRFALHWRRDSQQGDSLRIECRAQATNEPLQPWIEFDPFPQFREEWKSVSVPSSPGRPRSRPAKELSCFDPHFIGEADATSSSGSAVSRATIAVSIPSSSGSRIQRATSFGSGEASPSVSIPSSSGKRMQHLAGQELGGQLLQNASIPSSSGRRMQPDLTNHGDGIEVQFQSPLHRGDGCNITSSLPAGAATAEFQSPLHRGDGCNAPLRRPWRRNSSLRFNPLFIGETDATAGVSLGC